MAIGPLRQAHRELRGLWRGTTQAHKDHRVRLIVIGIASVSVDLIGSAIVFLFERHAPGTGIHTIGDSLFWTTTQLLTVSSQLPNPISTGGRITDIFLQFYAISIVATLAGSFGAWFNQRSEERKQPVSSY